MPALTFLSDDVVRAGRSVKDDKECDEILQDLRRLTGEDWIVRVREIPQHTWPLGFSKPPIRDYTLYADCHGEWQIINMAGPDGGTVFSLHPDSRNACMNFMLGMICGIQNERRAKEADHG